MEADLFRQRMACVVEQGRVALAERDDVRPICCIEEIEWEERAKAPEVLPLGVVPAEIGLLGLQALQIEHDLDGTTVRRVEVHDSGGRVLGAGTEAAQAADDGHEHAG